MSEWDGENETEDSDREPVSNEDSDDQSIPAKPAHDRIVSIEPGPVLGIRRNDVVGRGIIDALAGRASVFGFGFEPITDAIQAAAESYLGDASSLEFQQATVDSITGPLLQLLGESANIDTDSILLSPSADEAIDRAIGLVRRNAYQNAFRTIAFVGSDHGRTGMCRTASGSPELTAGWGPMMAGFHHVPVGDLDAVRGAIDEQTAAILLSPVDFADAARPLDADFLTNLRELCDAHSVMLVIDETRIAFGASGRPFSFSTIADIKADMVILSAGLFGGLPGGLIIASEIATDGIVIDTGRYPVQSAVVTATLSAMIEKNLPESAVELMQEFAVELAEIVR